MNTIKIDKRSTQMVAHRGLSGIETENTNSAFVAAGNRSYYGIETDIHKTVDGRFVTCHDFDLKRIAGENISVETSNYSDLENIVLFDKDGTKSRSDIRLSVLENYVSICKKYEKHCVLELKSDFTDEEIEQIIDIIKGLDYLESVTFITFVYSNIPKIKKICPDQSIQALVKKLDEETLNKLIEARIDVDVHYKALTKEIIDLFHENDMKVNCWTVDDKETAEHLCEWGVDFITTNILE